MSERNPYASPKANVDPSSIPSADVPALWNPNAAASWSLLFSPLFGAVIHMKNWQALGEPQKAANARSWAVASAVWVLVLVACSALLPNSKAIDGLSRVGGFGLLIAWYYASGKAQQGYVLAKFGKSYPRRGWAKPLLLALLVLVGFVAAMGALGALVAMVAGA